MTYETQKKKPKAVLVGVPVPGVSDADNESSLDELARLVSTLGFEVVGRTSQRRSGHGSGNLLGDGKLMELARMTGGTGKVEIQTFRRKSKAAWKVEAEKKKLDEAAQAQESYADETESEEEDLSGVDAKTPAKKIADVVAFDCDLSPSQLANLKSATGAEVLDRTGVIVEIFSRHAKTREAKLQVEIARLKYLSPRVRATGGGEDRIGTAGETSLELDKRKIRDRVAELRRELEDVQLEQDARRNKRSEQACVALVGYTNAGKSSLMRALTGSYVLVEDKLFATLDTTVRALYPDSQPRVLVSDTVGFIKKLPHDLVASFRSTLEEASNASLLLFVVDCSDSTFRSQLEVTKKVLGEIGVDDIPSQLILNKTDRLTEPEVKRLLLEFPGAFPMSTLSKQDVSALRDLILSHFEQDMKDVPLFLSYQAMGAIGTIRATMRVLEEKYEDDGLTVFVKAKESDLVKFDREFPGIISEETKSGLECFRVKPEDLD